MLVKHYLIFFFCIPCLIIRGNESPSLASFPLALEQPPPSPIDSDMPKETNKTENDMQEDAIKEASTEEIEATPEAEPRKSVGKAATDGSTTAKNRVFYQYALATGAIAVGITALVLVSQHKGHTPKH